MTFLMNSVKRGAWGMSRKMYSDTLPVKEDAIKWQWVSSQEANGGASSQYTKTNKMGEPTIHNNATKWASQHYIMQQNGGVHVFCLDHRGSQVLCGAPPRTPGLCMRCTKERGGTKWGQPLLTSEISFSNNWDRSTPLNNFFMIENKNSAKRMRAANYRQ
jgi:hypothetical protein